jgi:hypothetical protein
MISVAPMPSRCFSDLKTVVLEQPETSVIFLTDGQHLCVRAFSKIRRAE